MGKLLYLDLEANSSDKARERAEAMCERLLANPVTEDYQIDVQDDAQETVPA